MTLDTLNRSARTPGVNALGACRLERLIGKPSPDWSVDDLVGVAEREQIRLVSLMHVGGDGWLKTLDFVPRDPPHLRDVLAWGERADGSSVFGTMGVGRDRVRRRAAAASRDRVPGPFAQAPTLAVLCGHHGRDGAPLPTRAQRTEC